MGRNVILTGFMGTGKSSVGKLLATRLGYCFIDLDEMIVGETGMSINDIFSAHGEEHFRQAESRNIRRLPPESSVVSTGGGAVIDHDNRRYLHSLGIVINLTATREEILQRLKNDQERPLLREDKSLEKITAMLTEREPFYADADMRIDTVGKSVVEIVSEIVRYIEKRDKPWRT